MQQLNAADNPALAEHVIESVMGAQQSVEVPEVVVELMPPQDHVFELPGGHLTMNGDVFTEAEVRELTGRDEEAITKAGSTERILQEVLLRGTVRIGTEKPSPELMDMLLAGDRDYILLRIFVATFDRTIDVRPYCQNCQRVSERSVDLLDDVEVRKLDSPYERRLKVKISKGEAVVDLPNGSVQRKMIAAVEKSVVHLSSILLENTVSEINDVHVISPAQVLDLPIRDRRTLSEEIIKKSPGPQMQNISVTCDCGKALEVPLSLAALFQFS